MSGCLPFFTATISDFDSEALKYRKLGVFIGDAMLLGLSNALRIPLVVFTSVESWPYYFTIQPHLVPVYSETILLTLSSNRACPLQPSHKNFKDSLKLPLLKSVKIKTAWKYVLLLWLW